MIYLRKSSLDFVIPICYDINMAKPVVDKEEKLLKEIQERKMTESKTALMQALATFPNGEPPSTKALFDRVHMMIANAEKYAWSLSKVFAGMDQEIAVRLPVEIRKVEIEEKSMRAEITYHTFLGEDKDNLEHEEKTRTERTDTPEGKRVADLAKSLIGKRAILWKYHKQHTSIKKVGIISNIVPDTRNEPSETKTNQNSSKEETQTAPEMEVEETSSDDETFVAEKESSNLEGTPDIITTGKDLMTYGESLGFSKNEIKERMVDICGPLEDGGERTEEQFQSVANVLFSVSVNGEPTKTIELDTDAIEQAYHEVFIAPKPMADRLAMLGMENSEIKEVSSRVLPPLEKGTQRTGLQIQALYLSCLDQLKQELG